MEVAIRFSAVAYVSGENLDEIKAKWDTMPLFAEGVEVEFGDVDSVENTEDFEDLTEEFENY